MPHSFGRHATLLLLLLASPAGAQGELVARVETALAACELSAGCDVRVAAEGGRVTLRGHVRTLHERECIAIAAEKVPGVRFLEPLTVVRPSRVLPAAELEEAARDALRDRAGLQGPAPLTVSASGGHVVLGGQVRIPDDKYRAEDALRRVEGITELENRARVDPEEGLRRMEVELLELFHSREIPVEDLHFHEAEGRVVVSGRSHDIVARELLEAYTRDLPGGREVVNRVRIILRPTPEPR